MPFGSARLTLEDRQWLKAMRDGVRAVLVASCGANPPGLGKLTQLSGPGHCGTTEAEIAGDPQHVDQDAVSAIKAARAATERPGPPHQSQLPPGLHLPPEPQHGGGKGGAGPPPGPWCPDCSCCDCVCAPDLDAFGAWTLLGDPRPPQPRDDNDLAPINEGAFPLDLWSVSGVAPADAPSRDSDRMAPAARGPGTSTEPVEGGSVAAPIEAAREVSQAKRVSGTIYETPRRLSQAASDVSIRGLVAVEEERRTLGSLEVAPRRSAQGRDVSPEE
jgi:hypothetical protein